ncbi:SDR family oxidoreductase [Aliikangiella sp. IMCC44359]|uniref:SDR family oxidoreductase n=1 Tax=Aliikangiella sp. IMCC44359 TaxID=3459125 RepID=UPI00403AD649
MKSKSILITGCSSGIGLCAAKTLQTRGYQVYASVRSIDDVAKLEAEGLNALVLDLQNSNSIEKGLELVLNQTGGKLDYLFNNGAYGQPGAVEDLPTDILRQQFEANFFGWHHLTRLVIKVMREQGHGRIIQNSSVLGFVCMPYRGAYNASKYAIEGLTDTLRLELSDSPIFISLIEPGPIASKFRENAAKMFKQNIDWESSLHFDKYSEQLKRLEKKGDANSFTLAPDAVVKCLIHALESKRPKIRYRVTFPTKLFAILKPLLPTNILDILLNKS